MPTGTLIDEIVAAGAGAVRPGAALAARGPEMLGVAEVDQGVEAVDRLEDDVAALAAVAAVGAAIFDIFLAPEADRAGAAGAGADEDLGLVEEVHGGPVGDGAPASSPPPSSPRKRGSSAAFERYGRRHAQHWIPLSGDTGRRRTPGANLLTHANRFAYSRAQEVIRGSRRDRRIWQA